MTENDAFDRIEAYYEPTWASLADLPLFRPARAAICCAIVSCIMFDNSNSSIIVSIISIDMNINNGK